MAGLFSAFSCIISPYQTYFILKSVTSSVKNNITNTPSLWNAATSKTKNLIDTSSEMLMAGCGSINARIENTKNNISHLKNKIQTTDKTGLAVTVGCVATSALLLNYYRPDQIVLSAASYLITPALYATGAATFIACNAHGKGTSSKEAIEIPVRLTYRGVEAVAHRYSEFTKMEPRTEKSEANSSTEPKAEGSEANSSTEPKAEESEANSSIINIVTQLMTQKVKKLGSWLLAENIYAFIGAEKFFIGAGGQPKALLIGIGVNQAVMLLTDTGYITDPGLASVALSTGLAATTALASVIYYTESRLQPLPKNLEILSEKELEKEEERSL
jgi:hypothetical protein